MATESQQAAGEGGNSSAPLGVSGRIAAAFQDSRMTPLLALVAFLLGLFATLVTPSEEEPQIEATPGMFARVHFVTGEAEKLTVPAAAVLRRGEVAAVYVQSADNRLSLRQLRLGDAVGRGEIEVLAGLAAGDKVVTDPVKAGIALKSAAPAGK